MKNRLLIERNSFDYEEVSNMAIEETQIKFAESKQTGEVIGFVSRHSKTKKLKGVREDSPYGKKICVLSEDLKGTITPNVLYNVKLKPMHKQNGFVVVEASPVKFNAVVETIIVPPNVYQVKITFGNKTIYFDPLEGKSPSSRTIEGVVKILRARQDIDRLEEVVENFKEQADKLLRCMNKKL